MAELSGIARESAGGRRQTFQGVERFYGNPPSNSQVGQIRQADEGRYDGGGKKDRLLMLMSL